MRFDPVYLRPLSTIDPDHLWGVGWMVRTKQVGIYKWWTHLPISQRGLNLILYAHVVC